ncbi:hypothetical protein MR810_08220 [bacterium]|nr:hypothetical protein [bacterium]
MQRKPVAGPWKNILNELELHKAGLVDAEETVLRQFALVFGKRMGRGVRIVNGMDDAVAP